MLPVYMLPMLVILEVIGASQIMSTHTHYNTDTWAWGDLMIN